MKRIEWNRNFEVKVASIDEQHKKLVAMINSLVDATPEERKSEAAHKVLWDLVDYVKVHFAYEEKLMHTHNYPGIEAHKAMHKELVKKALELSKRIKSGAVTVGEELLIFLTNWLTAHIEGVDKRLGEFLESKGVK